MLKIQTDKIQIKEALLKRALGYEYEEKIVEAKRDGTQGKVKIFKKHIPPDPKSIAIICRMISSGQW